MQELLPMIRLQRLADEDLEPLAWRDERLKFRWRMYRGLAGGRAIPPDVVAESSLTDLRVTFLALAEDAHSAAAIEAVLRLANDGRLTEDEAERLVREIHAREREAFGSGATIDERVELRIERQRADVDAARRLHERSFAPQLAEIQALPEASSREPRAPRSSGSESDRSPPDDPSSPQSAEADDPSPSRTDLEAAHALRDIGESLQREDEKVDFDALMKEPPHDVLACETKRDKDRWNHARRMRLGQILAGHMRTCECGCGDTFNPKRVDQRFVNPTHRQRAKRQRDAQNGKDSQ